MSIVCWFCLQSYNNFLTYASKCRNLHTIRQFFHIFCLTYRFSTFLRNSRNPCNPWYGFSVPSFQRSLAFGALYIEFGILVKFRCGGGVVGVRRPFGARPMVVRPGARRNFAGNSVLLFVSHCKDTMNICLFPNFLAKKCKKLEFCNVEMAKQAIGEVWSCYSCRSCSKLWEDSKV